MERGLKGHARTQNPLADWVQAQGLTPRSPAGSEPNFDLAWDEGSTTFVVEVKSITATNQEKQLRLGLGQVLRYRHTIAASGRDCVAVLAAEREPDDGSWQSLCDELDVLLVFPGSFERTLSPSRN